MNERQKQLLQLIEEAFLGVELGNGVSLHETEVLDMYGSDVERQAARRRDEHYDWRNLIDDPELLEVQGIGGLCFFDAAGVRFHLPAYMSTIIKALDRSKINESNFREFDKLLNIASELEFMLTNLSEFRREDFSFLNAVQRSCIREFLIYLRDINVEWRLPDDTSLDQAINGYWSRP